MEDDHDRSWMYNRLTDRRQLTRAFLEGLETFIQFSLEQIGTSSDVIICPCVKCKCFKFQTPDQVREHLCRKGFMPDYECWHIHGEIRQAHAIQGGYYGETSQRNNLNEYEQLVMDAAGPSIGQNFEPDTHVEPSYMAEDPNPEAERFYNMLQDAQRPLWEGCEHIQHTEHTTLSATLATLQLKSDHHMSESAYNGWMQLMRQVVPKENNLAKDFYQAKRKVKELGLGCTKIHCCPKGCMLYCGDYM
ncbi:uncharacterized protein LOC133310502 [Gastrolobium bilobum]|uniref:uncharacterized protein LOC133310502 n=1 Tax=Gastrolobium bilobum TaxID=150636 RepID=UPI002AB06D29|nr:uncharacterized protein LOC133310502 [Gastrolobium bilobum]